MLSHPVLCLHAASFHDLALLFIYKCFSCSQDRAVRYPAKWAFPVGGADTKTFISEERSKAHDPFPIPREDGKNIYPFSDGYDDIPNTVNTPPTPDLRKVKMEENSPPLHEEPSSTTEVPGPAGNSTVQSVHENSCHSQADTSGFHDNVPLGLVTSSSNECTPDSTTAHVSPDEYAQVDSGYSSRLQSTSSMMMQSESGSAFMSSPESTLSGPSSIPKPSITRFQDLFSETAQFIATDLSSRSGSTSDPPHTPMAPTSIFQLDPVIQEIPTQCETTPNPQSCQVNASQASIQPQGTNSTQTVYGFSEQPPVNVRERQSESLRGRVTYSASVQQPLGYHGNYAPPTASSIQVDLSFNSPHSQVVVKQEPSPEISRNPCSGPTNNFASYQYHIAQQIQENGEPVLPTNFNFAQQQHVEGNATGVCVDTILPAGFDRVQHGGTQEHSCGRMNYGNEHVRVPAFTDQAVLPSGLAQAIPSANGRLHHPVNNLHHTTPQQGLFNGTSSNTTPLTSRTTTPLSHPPTFEGISMSFSVEDVSFRNTSQATSGQHPDLVRLTGEDLQILEYIDQLDSGGTVKHLTPHPPPIS